MKSIILFIIPFVVFASSETLSVREHMSIHNPSNHRPSVKMKKKQQLHKLHHVNEKEAEFIAQEETKEEVQSMKLTHQGKYFIYKIKTKHYKLIINAKDGTVMKKEIRNE